MRRILQVAVVTILVSGVPARIALAVSVDDLVNLKANGLSDSVLVDLIETDGSIFQLSAEDVIALHRRGLSDSVLRAMIRTGRQTPGAEVAAAREVAVPAAANVVVSVPVNVEVPVYVPVVVPVVTRPAAPVKAPEPVYWGFGGKLRPDTWQPTPASSRDQPAPSTAKSR